MSKGAVLISED